MSDEQISQFVIQSEIDNQKFTVDKKVIFSSVLLKNICDITDIREPIMVKCPGDSLKTFISLINHYQTPFDQENDDKFEKSLYCSLNKNELINLIQDLCVLDSDFFLDSIADYILKIIGEDEMDWNDIQYYLELENDFTENERILIDKNEKLEYFLSLDTENFTFPFFNKNLYSLKSAFSTPLNVLMARIIQRSSARTSYLLSLINKTIKNEVDRYPFKLSRFSADEYSCHLIYSPHAKLHFYEFSSLEITCNIFFIQLFVIQQVSATCTINVDAYCASYTCPWLKHIKTACPEDFERDCKAQTESIKFINSKNSYDLKYVSIKDYVKYISGCSDAEAQGISYMLEKSVAFYNKTEGNVETDYCFEGGKACGDSATETIAKPPGSGSSEQNSALKLIGILAFGWMLLSAAWIQ
uniref:Uncharacterized protein n=1 Tax=Panagrolaimus davidi TaxID=227884 RepID=A0A914NYF1_9BILA